MRKNFIIGFGLIAASAAWAQVTAPSTYGTRTGYGNVLFPGTGGPPQTYYNLNPNRPTFPNGPGAVGPGRVAAPQYAHPQHGRRQVIAVPVYAGGYWGGGVVSGFDTPQPAYYSDLGSAPPPPQAPPVVIINQAYRPEVANPVFRDYSDMPLPEPAVRTYNAPVHPTPDPKAREEAERPTLYMVAFKDHTVIPSLAYWVEGDTLNYVTKDSQINKTSLSLVDKDFSRQLNKERNVEFSLP